jgi:signal transduction histidine kinase/ligand-binding sensor domain-containing protein
MNSALIVLPWRLKQTVAGRLQRLCHTIWLACVACLLTLNCTDTALAAQYRYDAWTVGNGLPQNIIRGIAQTPDGYLWIATLDGLARFDGVRFTTFNKSNTPGIASNRFSSMVADPDGELWLSNESGGLTRYHHGSFHTYSAEDGIPANSVRGITGDGAGNLWLLSDESIMQWNKTTGELLDVTPDNLRIHYETLHWESAGFWGLDNSGLHIFTRGHFMSYPLPTWLPSSTIWGVGVDENGSVWIETEDGKQAVVLAGKQEAEPVDSAHPRPFSYRDPHGHVWTMHVAQRLTRFLDFESIGQAASIPMDRFLEDHEGNVWIGTEGSGLYRLQEQSVYVYSKAQGLRDSNIYPVYQDRSGAIWVGAWQSGLSRFSNGSFTNYGVAQGLPSPLVTALTEDRDGNLWVGTHAGLGIFKDGKFGKPFGVLLPERAIPQAMLQDRGGTMWIGTSSGLVLYRDGPTKTLTVQDGLATNDVRVIVESRSGDIWIGGYGGLTRVHGGQFTRWTESDGLPSDNIRAIYEDRDGAIWIGTYDGGLGRLKDGKITRYTEKNGLFNNGVFQILEDGRGNLWMSCNRGIYRVSKQELNAFADGRLATITSVAYGKSDGLLNVECNGGMWPAGIKTRDGKLWFPTQDGIAIVDPGTIRINPQSPPVVIEAASVDGIRASLDGLRIPPGKENLVIEYTALSFVHSDQIRFQYKLEGLDSGWIDAGSRRTAYYSHLPPGTYTFHVIARNSDGVWNDVGQSLTVAVLAPFYRTLWFTILEVLVFAGIIGIAVRYRLWQLEQKQAIQKAFSQQLIASQENERQRIAAELHDSLGQRLVVISNLALFSMRSQDKAGTAGGESGAMKEISAETALAIQETREISYNLRPFQLDRLGLTKAVEGILRSVAAASGIRITSEVDNIDDAFPADLRINFYRIVQESLNNVMKHAQATETAVRITRNKERITLSIRDNGKGFAAGTRPSKAGKSGFGLAGMAERANSLGGSFRVWSAPDQGTAMTVEIPLGGHVGG